MKRKDIRLLFPPENEEVIRVGWHYMFFETNIQDNSGAVKNPVSMLRLLRDDTPLPGLRRKTQDRATGA
jgi:hypothetical protein